MVKDVKGRTPLHCASHNGHLDIVKYFTSSDKVDPSCPDNDGITPIQVAAMKHQEDVVLYLHSKGEPLPSAYAPRRPISPRIKVFIVGNQSSGKSSLVRALAAERSWFGRSRNVGGVIPNTAGVLPSAFDSKSYGKVTLYDFAGHPEYYASHEVIFENATHPVIIVVVDLSEDHHAIASALRYWKLFLHTALSDAGNLDSTTGCQAHVIVVGSHADRLQSRDTDRKTVALMQFEGSPKLAVVGHSVLDCRKSASDGMSHLHDLLKRSCKMIRLNSEFDYLNGRTLNMFLTEHYSHVPACRISELQESIAKSEDPVFQQFASPDLLYQTCESLSTSGNLLLLKNKQAPEDSWVVLKKEAILSEVNGLLKHLKQCAPLGIVPLSLLENTLENHVQELLPDLATRFMKSMLFCSEVDLHALSLITKCHPATAKREKCYFFFPSLVTTEKPTQVWQWSSTQVYTYICGWHLKCTDPDHFFTPRFLQVLQMEMACKYALQVHPSSPGILEPHNSSFCNLWLYGIHWRRNGIEVVMHVSSDAKMLGVMLRCDKDYEVKCIRLRSTLIQKVFSIKEKILSTTQTAEYLVHPHLLKEFSIPEFAELPLTQIASDIIQKETSISLCPQLTNIPGYPFLRIQDLLLFEPYMSMGQQLLQKIFDPQNSSKLIEPQVLHKLAGALYERWKPLAKVLGTPPAVLATVDKESEFHKCLSILNAWSHSEGKGTYYALNHDLELYSIFCGRNPLNTPGIVLPTCPAGDDNPHFAIDDISEEKRAYLQKKPKLHQLLCMYPEGDLSQTPVRVLDVVSPMWDVVALSLWFEEHIIETIRRNYPDGCEGACRDMFGRWLQGRHHQPVTWETLIRSLYEAELYASLKRLGDKLVNVLCHPPTIPPVVIVDHQAGKGLHIDPRVSTQVAPGVAVDGKARGIEPPITKEGLALDDKVDDALHLDPPVFKQGVAVDLQPEEATGIERPVFQEEVEDPAQANEAEDGAGQGDEGPNVYHLASTEEAVN